MISKTFKLTDESIRFLKRYKRKHLLASVDATIKRMRDTLESDAQSESSSSDDVRDPRAAQPHMFSFAWFSDEPKAREYYSGLPTSAFDWLHDELMPEVSYPHGAVVFFAVVFPLAARAWPLELNGVSYKIPVNRNHHSCKMSSAPPRISRAHLVAARLLWNWMTS